MADHGVSFLFSQFVSQISEINPIVYERHSIDLYFTILQGSLSIQTLQIQ